MSKAKRYDVLSPDGIPIDRVNTYPSRKAAVAAFEIWKKRFEQQGYYSCRGERIPLEDLADYCTLTEI